MLSDQVMTLPELCLATGKSEAWWRRHWLRMHDDHGFPRRLPGLWSWPRRAVEEWCRAGGFPPPVLAGAAANQNEPGGEEAPSLLDRRFGAPRP